MATNKANGRANGKDPGPKETDEETAGPGHNRVLKTKEAEAYFKRFSRLSNELESKSGEIRADIKELYEEASAKLGVPRSVIREAFSNIRKEQKKQAKNAEREPLELEQLETLEAALGGFIDTPLGQSAAGRRTPTQDEATA